jgi:hypothetical protein
MRWLTRAEYLALMTASGLLMLLHCGDGELGRAAIAFAAIDLIGYMPGARAFRRARRAAISPIYHHLYNVTHNFLTAALVTAVWALVGGGFEWAMLALPLHLAGDRGSSATASSRARSRSRATRRPRRATSPRRRRDDRLAARRCGPRSDVAGRSHRPPVRLPRPVVAQPPLHGPRSGGVRSLPAPGAAPAGARRRARAEDSRADLLDAFLRDAARDCEQVVALQVRARDVDLFRSRGFRVDAFGSSFALALPRFSFAGTKRMKLRNRIKRARDAGVTVFELGRDRACPPDLWRRLAEISRAWLATKGGHELDLLVGEMGEAGDPNRRLFVALDRQQQPLGFITYVPVWGERPGVLHDLTRRAPDAPAGVMELINATALARFQEEEIRFLHFGFTPFLVGMGGAAVERPDHWLVPRLVRFIGAGGARSTRPARSFSTSRSGRRRSSRAEYIAFQQVSLGALFALLIATRSLVLPWRKALPAQETK